jgi:hypothetical protein
MARPCPTEAGCCTFSVLVQSQAPLRYFLHVLFVLAEYICSEGVLTYCGLTAVPIGALVSAGALEHL